MARLARLYAPDCPQLVLQRCASGRELARDALDFATLIEYLGAAVRSCGVALHAFVLMPDHLHLVATPRAAGDVSRLMQSLGRRYVQYFNRRHGESGALWGGRYRATLIEPERYLLIGQRYVEGNPVRAGLTEEADHYRYSSLRHHIGTETLTWMTDHALYWALGNTPFERQRQYRLLFDEKLGEAELSRIRAATWGGWALGSEAFVASLTESANRRAAPLARGRPAMHPDDSRAASTPKNRL